MKSKEIWIKEDQTFKERKMRWKIRNLAEEERKKGNRVRQEYGKIWIEDRWWYWDEEGDTLRNRRGRKREEETGAEGEEERRR